MAWTLTLRAYPLSGNRTLRMHWVNYRKLMIQWFWMVRTAHGLASIPGPTGRRRLTIQLHGRQAIDRDNRYAACKPLVDVLRPAKHESGVYKSGKKKGLSWNRQRLGLGLIVDDDDVHLDLQVPPVLKVEKDEDPFVTLTLEDLENAS
jgi:hypothetical protein